MSYCDGYITQNIEQDCDNPVVGGIEQEGVIVNRRDIDVSQTEYEPDSAGPPVVTGRKNVITKIGLKAGKKAYKVIIPGNQPFNGTTTTMEAGTNRNTFTNNVGMVILNNDPDVCENIIDGLATGEFVCILENKYKNVNKATHPGDSTFQIYGYYQGLKATTLENDKYSEDTEGGWNVVLTETKSPKSGLFYFDTDIETTRAKIESLTTA